MYSSQKNYESKMKLKLKRIEEKGMSACEGNE